jgi:outer membrane protein OmpA-like peptidoglycan-associated protein
MRLFSQGILGRAGVALIVMIPLTLSGCAGNSASNSQTLAGVIITYMDEHKKDLEKELAPEINAGQAQVRMLPDKTLQVTMTGRTAFPPGSAMINANFVPTLRKIAGVVNTYGETTVRVIGHPDPGGTVAERTSMANLRAEMVKNLFLEMGVSPMVLTASGDPDSNYLDGRVELVIRHSGSI